MYINLIGELSMFNVGFLFINKFMKIVFMPSDYYSLFKSYRNTILLRS